MSAMGGAIPVRLPAEIEPDGSGNGDGLGGIVIPLRVERQAPVERAGPPALELDPISPELALVDPELARAARALLPDVPRFAAVPAVFVEQLGEAPPVTRGRLSRLLTLTGLLALGAGLTLLIGSAPTRPHAQSVAVERTTTTPSPPATLRTPGTPRTATTPSTPAAHKPAKPATSAPRRTPSTPEAQKPAKPAALHAPALAGQTFVWVAAPGASAYEFQLFQRGERIFRTRVVKPRLVLPGRWRQGGRPYALVPGDYRWYVWPVSSRTKRQSGVATVQAKLVIEEQPR